MHLLLLLSLAAFASSLSLRVLDPVIPEIARDLSTQIGTAALLASAIAFPCALGQPILGAMGDAIGKARMIKLCLCGLAIGSAASALATTIETLFAARILTGFASGGIIPLCFATVGDRFGMKERQVALSRVLSAILFGQLAGAIGAGIIASIASWRVVLAIACLIAVIALATILLGLKPLPGAVRKPFTIAGMLASYGRVLANPRAFVCYGAVFVEGMALFGILPFLAAMLEAEGSGSIKEAGFVISGLAIGGILYTLLVGRILGVTGMHGMIRLGGVLCCVGMLGLGLLHVWPLKMAAFLVVGVGFYMIHNSIQTQATELVPEARGASVALHAFSFFLGQAMGPVLFGLGLAQIGAFQTLAIAAGVMLMLGFATAEGFARVKAPVVVA